MSQSSPPRLDGVWSIEGELLEYKNPQQKKVDLDNPKHISLPKVIIQQKGRFFTYDSLDGRQPKLGVFEAVHLQGKFLGWKAHMVDTRHDNELFIFNFTKICSCNKVKRFDIVYKESGYGTVPHNQQRPRVEFATARRVK